ncbi:MAG TPA: Rad52/Rad22 family DNA repair protein [Blastocatellia bacterium]|nr:Rad52/Rad22 family DNA repair protein [Blastocatellia bacterium]
MVTSMNENRNEPAAENANQSALGREITIKKAVQRHKRAQSLAAMGLVSREGDRFRVTTPAPRGKQVVYEVWRNEGGRVCCTCPEFEEQSVTDAAFRCEHILAVKHTLSAGTQETQNSATPQPGIVASTPAASDSTPKIMRRREEDEMPSEEVNTNVHEGQADNQSAAQSENSPQSKANVVPMAFTNLLRTLRQPIDPKLVRTREGWTDRQGNTHIVEYVEWHTVADILDRVAPTWSHSVRNITQIGDMVAVTAAITVDGVTREGVGTGTAESETGIKKAEHDALKRAAIKFGIARDLYQRESEVIERQGAHNPGNSFPRDPLAKSLADLVTPKQLGMIRALGREIGCDIEQECQSLMSCGTEELSKMAASRFIDYLKRKQEEKQNGMQDDDLLRAG